MYICNSSLMHSASLLDYVKFTSGNTRLGASIKNYSTPGSKKHTNVTITITLASADSLNIKFPTDNILQSTIKYKYTKKLGIWRVGTIVKSKLE